MGKIEDWSLLWGLIRSGRLRLELVPSGEVSADEGNTVTFKLAVDDEAIREKLWEWVRSGGRGST